MSSPDGTPPAPLDGLGELRSLLSGREQVEIARLKERVANPVLRTADVQEVLPDALAASAKGGGALARVLVRPVEEALGASVARDPARLARLLVPSVAKAVSLGLREWLEDRVAVLERRFSPRALVWRLRAMSRRVPFARIVAENEVLWRVEQAFLIQRRTGFALEHVARKDVVGGLEGAKRVLQVVEERLGSPAPAVSDRVHDPALATTIWIEVGERAVLACEVRGDAPDAARAPLREALATIHERLEGSREGLVEKRSEFTPLLARCLLEGWRGRRLGESSLVWSLVALVVGLAVAGIAWRDIGNRRLAAYAGRLGRTPGIVVTEARRSGFDYVVSGLRDPLAAEVTSFLREARLDPVRVRTSFVPYLSLDPAIVAARAARVLEPPPGVTVAVDEGVLRVSGLAPRAWIREARERARGLAGVDAYSDEALIDRDFERLAVLAGRIGERTVAFAAGSSLLPTGSDVVLREQAGDIAALLTQAARFEQRVGVTISGRSDPGGVPADTWRGRERAQRVLAALVAHGVAPEVVTARGEPAADDGRAIVFQIALEER